MSQLFSDRMFDMCHLDAVGQHLRTSHQNVFTYKLQHDGEHQFVFGLFPTTPDWYKSCKYILSTSSEREIWLHDNWYCSVIVVQIYEFQCLTIDYTGCQVTIIVEIDELSNVIFFSCSDVGHADDILYLFGQAEGNRTLKRDEDLFVSRIMVELWTNFASVG